MRLTKRERQKIEYEKEVIAGTDDCKNATDLLRNMVLTYVKKEPAGTLVGLVSQIDDYIHILRVLVGVEKP